jgi:large subunit ribosomal protein L9
MTMKVILNDHIEHLGERGDVVAVKPGFARNYLLPQKLAYLDTPGNRKLFAQEQKTWEEMDLKRRSAAEKMAAEMRGLELGFQRRASEQDVLFGSVSAADIARALEGKGFAVDRRRIVLDHAIKELGSFEIEVRVHSDIGVRIPVHVTRPGDQAMGEAAPPEGAIAGVTERVEPTAEAAEGAADEP